MKVTLALKGSLSLAAALVMGFGATVIRAQTAIPVTGASVDFGPAPQHSQPVALAFDGDTSTFTYGAQSGTQSEPNTFYVPFNTATNGFDDLRIYDIANNGGNSPSSFSLYYTTDTNADPTQRAYQPVQNLSAGIVQPQDGLPVTINIAGPVSPTPPNAFSSAGGSTAAHDSTNYGYQGWYSLSFAPVNGATGYALQYVTGAPDPVTSVYPPQHDAVAELQAIANAPAAQNLIGFNNINIVDPNNGNTVVNRGGPGSGNGNDVNLAIDHNSGSFSYLTPSNYTDPGVALLGLDQSTLIDGLRVEKQTNHDDGGGVNTFNLTLMYSNDALGPADPNFANTFHPVSLLAQNGSTFEPTNGSVTAGGNTVSGSSDAGAFMLNFAPVQALYLAYEFTRSDFINNNYAVQEFQALVAPVPEPASVVLLGIAGVLLAAYARRGRAARFVVERPGYQSIINGERGSMYLSRLNEG